MPYVAHQPAAHAFSSRVLGFDLNYASTLRSLASVRHSIQWPPSPRRSDRIAIRSLQIIKVFEHPVHAASRRLGKSHLATELSTLADYVKRIEARKPNAAETRFYRGHTTPGHNLQPGLFRARANRKHERNILRELISLHPSDFAGDSGTFEQLVRMQHFSLLTRLLDVTNNPLVALYFACGAPFNQDGEVIYLAMSPRAVRYFDSDTVSCLANLSNLSGNERDELRSCASDADVAASNSGKRLLQFIKAEKPYFLPNMVRTDLDGPVAVKPRLTNRRLLAQQGAFMIFGLKTSLLDDNDNIIKIVRMTVPGNQKKKLRDSLDKIGVNQSTMFPEIESAAQYVMSKITPATETEAGD